MLAAPAPAKVFRTRFSSLLSCNSGCDAQAPLNPAGICTIITACLHRVSH